MAAALAGDGDGGMRPAVVIGIGGASGCGKTSQSARLAEALRRRRGLKKVTVMSCDEYFIEAGPPPAYQDRLYGMEGPESIAWEAVVRDVRALASDARDGINVIIVESFLLFSHPPLLSLFSFVLFLNGRKDKCVLRRIGRNPHRSADESFHLARYYDGYVWPGYLRHTVPACASLVAERSRHDDGRHAFLNTVRVDANVGADGDGSAGGGAGAIGGSRDGDDGSVDMTSDEVAAEMLRLAVKLLGLTSSDSELEGLTNDVHTAS